LMFSEAIILDFLRNMCSLVLECWSHCLHRMSFWNWQKQMQQKTLLMHHIGKDFKTRACLLTVCMTITLLSKHIVSKTLCVAVDDTHHDRRQPVNTTREWDNELHFRNLTLTGLGRTCQSWFVLWWSDWTFVGRLLQFGQMDLPDSVGEMTQSLTCCSAAWLIDLWPIIFVFVTKIVHESMGFLWWLHFVVIVEQQLFVIMPHQMRATTDTQRSCQNCLSLIVSWRKSLNSETIWIKPTTFHQLQQWNLRCLWTQIPSPQTCKADYPHHWWVNKWQMSQTSTRSHCHLIGCDVWKCHEVQQKSFSMCFQIILAANQQLFAVWHEIDWLSQNKMKMKSKFFNVWDCCPF